MELRIIAKQFGLSSLSPPHFVISITNCPLPFSKMLKMVLREDPPSLPRLPLPLPFSVHLEKIAIKHFLGVVWEDAHRLSHKMHSSSDNFSVHLPNNSNVLSASEKSNLHFLPPWFHYCRTPPQFSSLPLGTIHYFSFSYFPFSVILVHYILSKIKNDFYFHFWTKHQSSFAPCLPRKYVFLDKHERVPFSHIKFICHKQAQYANK